MPSPEELENWTKKAASCARPRPELRSDLQKNVALPQTMRDEGCDQSRPEGILGIVVRIPGKS